MASERTLAQSSGASNVSENHERERLIRHPSCALRYIAAQIVTV